MGKPLVCVMRVLDSRGSCIYTVVVQLRRVGDLGGQMLLLGFIPVMEFSGKGPMLCLRRIRVCTSGKKCPALLAADSMRDGFLRSLGISL